MNGLFDLYFSQHITTLLLHHYNAILSESITWAPSWAISSPVDFPKPDAPPVINATLPSSLPIFISTIISYGAMFG